MKPAIALPSAALIALAAFALPSRPAPAAPKGEITCRLITYYSSAAKKVQVGEFSSCPGGRLTGRRTQWYTVETYTVGHPPANPGGNGGSLPCEFTAGNPDECNNLPHGHGQ